MSNPYDYRYWCYFPSKVNINVLKNISSAAESQNVPSDLQKVDSSLSFAELGYVYIRSTLLA